MLEAQSDHTADIVQFIRPDDAVPVVTGIGFIDVDPKILARRIRPMSWPERAQIVSDAISDALEAVDKMSDLDLGSAQTRRLVEWALLEVQRAVGRLLHEFGEDEPGDAAAALVSCRSTPSIAVRHAAGPRRVRSRRHARRRSRPRRRSSSYSAASMPW